MALRATWLRNARCEDVEGDVRLIADRPAVVSGRDVEEVASPHHHFASVVHLGHGLTAQYEADLLNLARRLTSHRPDVLRPFPTRPGSYVARPSVAGPTS